LGAVSAKCLGKLPLAAAVAIRIGGIEKVDAEITVCQTQHLDGFVVRLLAPPAGGEGPRAEPDLTHLNVGSGELPIAHS